MDQPTHLPGSSGICFWHQQHGITYSEFIQKKKKKVAGPPQSPFTLKKGRIPEDRLGEVVWYQRTSLKVVVGLCFDTQLCWVALGKSPIIPIILFPHLSDGVMMSASQNCREESRPCSQWVLCPDSIPLQIPDRWHRGKQVLGGVGVAERVEPVGRRFREAGLADVNRRPSQYFKGFDVALSGRGRCRENFCPVGELGLAGWRAFLPEGFLVLQICFFLDAQSCLEVPSLCFLLW